MEFRFGDELPKELFEINGLDQVEPYVRRLALRTSRLSNPLLLVSVGSKAAEVEHVLNMAADCECRLDVAVKVHHEFRDRVIDALELGDKISITSEQVIEHGNIPSFLVSEAGYYIQRGLSFDEARFSFRDDVTRKFLVDAFYDFEKDSAA